MGRDINSVLYTEIKYIIKSNRSKKVIDENGYLFANAKYPTKLKIEDLPPWFVGGYYNKLWGYLSAKDVVDLEYIPEKEMRYFMKDDTLLVSYNKSITQSDKDAKYGLVGYDKEINGYTILPFLYKVYKYSDINIDQIIEHIKENLSYLCEKYPQDYGGFIFNIDDYFDKKDTQYIPASINEQYSKGYNNGYIDGSPKWRNCKKDPPDIEGRYFCCIVTKTKTYKRVLDYTHANGFPLEKFGEAKLYWLDIEMPLYKENIFVNDVLNDKKNFDKA